MRMEAHEPERPEESAQNTRKNSKSLNFENRKGIHSRNLCIRYLFFVDFQIDHVRSKSMQHSIITSDKVIRQFSAGAAPKNVDN